MLQVDRQTMLEVAPRFSGKLAACQAKIVTEVGEVLAATLAAYGIDTRLRIAHFLAQTCHESAGFRTCEEFADGSAYEGRADLGCTQPGDGPRYKGRGLLQLTGRANYRTYGRVLGCDLEGNPDQAAEPRLSLRIACEYWKRHRINALCDHDDVVAVTRAINGGINGLDDRRALTAKAKAALARLEGMVLSGATGVDGLAEQAVLRRGSQGEAVGVLQAALRGLGFAVAIDNDFGAGTEVAVMKVQSDAGLLPDGIVGPKTWSLLNAKPAPTRAA